MRKNRIKKRKKTLIAIYWLFFAIIAVAFLASSKFSADTTSSNYCSSEIRNSDQSVIDMVTQSSTNRVKKGDNFVVLILSEKNDFAATYSIDILKQGDSIMQKSGSLDSMTGLKSAAQEKMSTAGLSVADYIVKVKLYHAENHCLVVMKEMNLQVIAADDISAPNGVQLFDNGDVVIGSSDKQIEAGGTFKINIENKFTKDFKYEIKVNDLTTGIFVTKTSDIVKAGSSIGAWATISSAGNHIVEVDILTADGSNLLYTQRFNAIVTNPSSGVTSPKTETSTGSGITGGQISNVVTSGASTSNSGREVGVGVSIPGSNTNSYSYKTYICAVYSWALRIGYGLTLLMSVVAGYFYMTSGGDSGKLGTAKDIIISSILGFALLLLVNLILKVLNVSFKC